MSLRDAIDALVDKEHSITHAEWQEDQGYSTDKSMWVYEQERDTARAEVDMLLGLLEELPVLMNDVIDRTLNTERAARMGWIDRSTQLQNMAAAESTRARLFTMLLRLGCKELP